MVGRIDGACVRPRIALGGLVAAVAVAAWFASPTRVLGALRWAADEPFRLAFALVLVAILRPLLAWPTTLLAVVVGYGFGLVGAPFALGLVTLSSLPAFLAARHLGRDSGVGDAGRRIVAETGELRSVVASRLVPAPSDLVSAAAGVSGVRTRTFLAGTAIGEVPWVAAGTLAGASLVDLSADGLGSAGDPRLVVAAGLLAILVLAGPVYRVVTGRQNAGEP